MTIRYRRFGTDENEVVGKIFVRAYNALLTGRGSEPFLDVEDQAAWEEDWLPDRKALFEHFSGHENEGWLAELDGEAVGYARSICRGGVWQLTDFWVLPHDQARGIGLDLLNRTFPYRPDGPGRIALATTDAAAMARYVKSGLEVLCPVLEFSGSPEGARPSADVSAEPMAGDENTLRILNRLDRDILGFERPVDHQWFLARRRGYLYRRGGEPIGYGYVAEWQGPFAALDPADLPAILAHAETETVASGNEMDLIVPMANSTAMRYLLARGFKMNDKFVMLFMGDRPRPQLDRYIIWWPGFC